jgi:hypothetical protein
VATECTERIAMGDQGVFHCPCCMECECCTEDWVAKHGHLDYECVEHEGVCLFANNHNFPRHTCPKPSPTGTE